MSTCVLVYLPTPGEGNGNPLQCSCLENPRDGGAWWAGVYGVALGRTRLKKHSSITQLLSILLKVEDNLNLNISPSPSPFLLFLLCALPFFSFFFFSPLIGNISSHISNFPKLKIYPLLKGSHRET